MTFFAASLLMATGCARSSYAAVPPLHLVVSVVHVRQADVPVLAGVPSALLERRPDIRAAEQSLIAANAEIGVARAAYLPTVGLSGFLDDASTQLTSLFSGPNSTYNLTPQVAQPIFMAGRIKSNVRLAQAERDRALVQYERTFQTAFTEISDALIAHQRVREAREKEEALVASLTDRLRLAYLRCRGGVDTQLNALDADPGLFPAELGSLPRMASGGSDRGTAL